MARVNLRVAPGAKRTGVVGRYRDGWKVRVTAAPESGKANGAVVKLLSDALSLPVARIEIVAGHTSRNKVVEIDGLSLSAVNDALELAI